MDQLDQNEPNEASDACLDQFEHRDASLPLKSASSELRSVKSPQMTQSDLEARILLIVQIDS